MTWLKNRFFSRFIKAKSNIFLLVIIFSTLLLSGFDVCWFFVDDGVTDNGFIFDPSWKEHLHSSEGWSIYYQVQALSEGRIWLSQESPPEFCGDYIMIGDFVYAPFEPLVSILLLPFYTLGESLLGLDYLIRSVLVGIIFFTCICGLVLRQISLQLGSTQKMANFVALTFSLATMAFSYSRLIYPQPIFTMLALLSFLFIIKFNKSKNSKDLFFFSLFFGFALNSFNAFVIVFPFILYYLARIELFAKRENLLKIGLGFLPGIILFLGWNLAVTGNPLITPRQFIHSTIDFEVLYLTAGGTALNFGGLFGSLFSPLGIFFVSPILLLAFFGFSTLRKKARNETFLLASVIITFWLFNSFANLGGAAGQDFWVGGWANIARYMYLPSTLLVIFAAEGVTKIHRDKNFIAIWVISLITIISFLANFTYGVRHDLMVTHPQDFWTNGLMIWPYPIESLHLTLVSIGIFSLSILYPLYLFIKQRIYQKNDLDSEFYIVDR